MLLAQFSEAVHGIYDATLSPERWPAALDGVAALSGSRGAIVWAKDAGGWSTPMHSACMAGAMEAYAKEGWARQNPWLESRLEAGFRAGDVYRDLDIVTREEMETKPFYTDFLHRFGLGRQMVAIIYSDLGNPTCLVAHRDMATEPFQTDEMQTHLLVGRHFEQSLRITFEFSKLRTAHHSVSAAFDAVDRPMFIVDERSRPFQINRSAQELMDTYFVHDQGQLKPVSPSEEQAFFNIVQAAHGFAGDDGGEPRPVTLSGKNSKERIVVWGVPLVGASADKLGFTKSQKHVLVVAQPLLRQRLIDPTVIRSAYGLTTGEARLAALLAGGRSVKQAADELGLTEGTTRFVLNRIFQKVGVHRQSELVASILTLAR